MENSKKKNTRIKNKTIKVIIAIIAMMLLIICADILIKKVDINGLEGYMYSLATDIVDRAATSSDATSSNATSSNATCGNATSSNVSTMTLEEINKEVEKELQKDYYEKYYKQYDDYEEFYNENYEEYYNRKVEEIEEKEKNQVVTFLEDNKIYIIIIGIASLTAIITGVILIVDKKTKRHNI